MPAGLSRADKRLMWGAVIVVLLLAAGALIVNPTVEGEESEVPSSYSSDSGGALAAYLLLEDLGFNVRRWSNSPLELPSDTRDTILIVAEPTEAPTPVEREALQRFVRSGGHVLYCGGGLELFFDAGVLSTTLRTWESYTASLPSPYTAGAPRIDMRPSSEWGNGTPLQLPLYGSQDDPVVVVWSIGQGEVTWWAGPGPLTNAGITRPGNLRFFLNAMRESDGEPRTVYWDEYFHGQRGSLWSYIERTPVAWGLAQLGILLVAVVFTFSRRSGPMVEPEPVSRQSPLEFVDTMGSLYERARATSIPVETAYRLLRLRLAQRLSMPVVTADAPLAEAAGERLKIDAADLVADLDTARSSKPTRKEALALVQKLRRHTLQLKENR